MGKSKKNKGNVWTANSIEKLMEEANAKLAMVMTLYSMGLSPQTYTKLIDILDSEPDCRKWKNNPELLVRLLEGDDHLMDKFDQEHHNLIDRMMLTLLAPAFEDMSLPEKFADAMNKGRHFQEMDDLHYDDVIESKYVPRVLANYEEKTIRLKIKLKNINKPPVWREVDVPAWYNFVDLHEVIQIVFGWSDYHLWQFQENVNKSPYAIMYDDVDYYGDEEIISPYITIATFLKEKGNKIEYLYDYGDDWIHEISVVKVIDKEGDYPVLLKSSGEMMIEDVGGPHVYFTLRQVYNHWSDMDPENRLAVLHMFGYEDEQHFRNMFRLEKVDLDAINEELKEM